MIPLYSRRQFHPWATRRRRLAGALAFAWAFALPCAGWFDAAEAREGDQPALVSVRVGFAGRYKLGCWTPLWVTVRAGGSSLAGAVEFTALDGDGVPATYASAASVALAPGETREVFGLARFGRPFGGVTCVWRGETRSAAGQVDTLAVSRAFSQAELAPLPPLSATDGLYVALGRDVGLAQALARRAAATRERTAACVVKSPGELPTAWIAYEGVEWLAIPTSQPENLAQLTPAQITAIEDWTRLGGKLLLSVGAAGQRVLGPADSPWRVFTPGDFRDVLARVEARGLETHAGGQFPLDAASRQRGETFEIWATRLTNPRGRVEAHEGADPREQPWVVRAPLDFGQVVFAAVDLDAPPLADWQGRPRLVAKLLQGAPGARRSDDESAVGAGAQLGFSDLTGQLRAALDQYQGARFADFSWVALLAGAYIVLIGPVDYFVLRKLVGNMTYTWLTFPLVVAAFCAAVYFVALADDGAAPALNMVELIDVALPDEASSPGGAMPSAVEPATTRALVRGVGWAALHSPRTQAFDVEWSANRVENAAPGGSPPGPREDWLAFQGLPGEAFGGMSNPSPTAAFTEPYMVAPAEQPTTFVENAEGADPAAARLPTAGLSRLLATPLQLSSSKHFSLRWRAVWNLPSAGRLAARPGDGLLEGELRNPLPVELRDVAVFYDSWAYLLEGALAPGKTARLGGRSLPRTLDWHLTRRRIALDQKETAPRWDQAALDTPRVLQMLMFHEAAGGQRYTRLTHAHQGYCDLSGHLRLDRAVLVGRAEEAPSVLRAPGAKPPPQTQQRVVYYRVLIPVERAPGSGR